MEVSQAAVFGDEELVGLAGVLGRRCTRLTLEGRAVLYFPFHLTAYLFGRWKHSSYPNFIGPSTPRRCLSKGTSGTSVRPRLEAATC